MKVRSAVDVLLEKVNDENLDFNDATESQQKEMWTFSHEAGTQQAGWTKEELTDYRYIGKDPNNYIQFNNEVWRIIGVMTVEKADETKEKLVKIMKQDPINTSTAWDTGNVNDWSRASLQTALNEAYLNQTGIYASGGLNKTSRNQIENVKWYLGGTTDYTSASTGLAKHFYQNERGTNVYSGRMMNWFGYVGLMYPSDYGFATSGTTGSLTRQACLNKEMFSWFGAAACYQNDWIFDSEGYQWTLSPRSSNAIGVFSINNLGYVNGDSQVTNTYWIRPVVFLKSSVEIIGGDGGELNPYTIS